MEREISEKVQRLTRILTEEASKFPGITVDQYSTGIYGYDWKVYLEQERQLGTISFTTEVTLAEHELRAAFRHELKALIRNQASVADLARTRENGIGHRPHLSFND